MKKKLLEKITLKTVELSKNKKPWTINAELIDAEGQKVLMISFYRNESCENHKSKLPTYRLFITENEDMMLNTQTGEWFYKKIDYLPEFERYWNLSEACDIDNESIKAIDLFIPEKFYYSKDPVTRIRYKQDEIRRDRAQRALDNKIARINAEMQPIDKIPLPDDFEEFIDDVFSNSRYIFYKSETNKRYIQLYCAHCGKTTKIDTKTEDRPKHNETAVCAACGSRAIYKASGRKDRFVEHRKFIVMQKIAKGFVSRYLEVTKITSTENGEKFRYFESARAIYNGEYVKTYYNNNGAEKLNEIYWWDRNGDYKVRYGTGFLYYKNLSNVLGNTLFKYCALDILAEKLTEKKKPLNQDAFLRAYERYRFIEYFIKMGLYTLANELVEYTWTTAINAKGKNPQEILRLPRQQINRIIKMDGNLYMLKLLQEEEKEGSRFTDEQIMFLSENNIDLENLSKVLEYTTITKAIRYLRDNRAYGTYEHLLIDWTDYIENCKTLKYDLKNEFVLFPKHLKAAHDKSVNDALAAKNESLNKEFIEAMKDIKERYSFETKTFAIVVPNTTGEITYEGQQLHHCVGTYVDRIVKKETVILFIRKKEEINVPFYTMEVRNGAIIQVRGKFNCDMTPQVKQFVESFKKHCLIEKMEVANIA